MLRVLVSALLFALAPACVTPPAGPPERLAGERRPLSAACETLDGTRCLLPWPSNTYTVADPTTPTGLRLALTLSSLPVKDSPASLNQADGFSPVTPLAVGFPSALAAGLAEQRATHAVRLFAAQPGRDDYGAEVPLRLHVVADGVSEATLLLAYPMRPLAFDTDYVAVVTDEVTPAAGGTFVAPRSVAIAVGAQKPATDAERTLAAYHAPTRALLARVGVAAEHVLRAWDFTTRSAQRLSEPALAMRAQALEAVDAGALTVTLTSAALVLDGGAIAVRGHVGGLPFFVSADGGVLNSVAQGTHEAAFRALLPAGDGDFPLVVFGHGTGGSVDDATLDALIVASGAGKLNVEFIGWTHGAIGSTLLGFDCIYTGTARSTAGLAQSLVDASGLEAALGAQLGAALSADTLAGVPNPAAGRHVKLNQLAWVGASLGGTLGFAHAQAEPEVRAAVLNVPGAGWTHFAFQSNIWTSLDEVFRVATPSGLDRALGLASSQTNWDLVDGAAWSAMPGAAPKPLLVQESLGDPVLPNLGNELVAVSARAVQVGKVLSPVVGVAPATEAVGRAGFTQFDVPLSGTDTSGRHGFVDGDTGAGLAAREQIAAFLASVWAGAPRIVEPPRCLANGDAGCDFTRQ